MTNELVADVSFVRKAGLGKADLAEEEAVVYHAPALVSVETAKSMIASAGLDSKGVTATPALDIPTAGLVL